MRGKIVAGLVVGTIAGMAAGITVAKGMSNNQAAQKWMKRGRRMFRAYMRSM